MAAAAVPRQGVEGDGIRDLTVDVGVGNPGVTGIQYIANNQGAMRNVTLRSSDPQRAGHIGLDLGYTNEQGPCLLSRITVEGFDIGVRTKHAVDGVVAEFVTLRNQRQVGWLNDGQCVSLRGLKSENAVPAYHNRARCSAATGCRRSTSTTPTSPAPT